LVRFVFLGAVLLVADGIRTRGDVPPERVEVTPALREQLRRDFQLRNRRSMTLAEERTEVTQWVDEELLFRMALRLGMHEADIIVRRRLVQRMRFLHEDMVKVAEPTEAQLSEWISGHPQKTSEAVTFDHVFLARSKHSNMPEDVQALRAALMRGELPAGDAMPVPFSTTSQREADLAHGVGPSVASAIMKAPLNDWIEPLESAYGTHLVRVRSRTSPPLPEPLVRSQARRGWMDVQGSQVQNQLLARLRSDFEVVGEESAEAQR
jgi:hypothetical protein